MSGAPPPPPPPPHAPFVEPIDDDDVVIERGGEDEHHHHNHRQQQQQHPQLEDMDAWLERHGLRDAQQQQQQQQANENNVQEEGDDDDVNVADDGLNASEMRSRMKNEESYQRSIHKMAFADVDAKELARLDARTMKLESWKMDKLILEIATTTTGTSSAAAVDDDDKLEDDDKVHHQETTTRKVATSTTLRVPLMPWAATCDFVYCLADTWEHFNPTSSNETATDTTTNSSEETAKAKESLLCDGDDQHRVLQLSLTDFNPSAVRAYIEWITFQFNEQQKQTRKKLHHNLEDGKEEEEDLTNKTKDSVVMQSLRGWLYSFRRRSVEMSNLQNEGENKSDDGGGGCGDNDDDEWLTEMLVEFCRMSHYLQNESLLEETHNLLIDCVTTENCIYLCQLSDTLHLPRLLERALSQLLKTVSTLQDADAWEHLTDDLQERILTLQNALTTHMQITSSVAHPYGRQSTTTTTTADDDNKKTNKTATTTTSSLYFSSLEEYMAMFAERIEYYEERLLQAKNEMNGFHIMNPGRRHIPRATHTDYQAYVTKKIQQQEIRITSLKRAFREQKKLFASRNK